MASDVEGIAKRLKQVIDNINETMTRRPKSLPDVSPRLVAVSKTKPNTSIGAAYQAGQRHFGENYIKELEEKSTSRFIKETCPDIKWHFIGHVQSNKAKRLAAFPNLYMVETIHCRKIAHTLNNSWQKLERPGSLLIMVQVNTSNEDNKNGCDPEEVVQLVSYIREKCSSLTFKGLMTIGALGYNPADGPNPDFLCLVKCREDLCQKLNIPIEEVELSMGMSTDYQHAIELGSTNVRVGSTIFGSRDYPAKDAAASGVAKTNVPKVTPGGDASSQSNVSSCVDASVSSCVTADSSVTNAGAGTEHYSQEDSTESALNDVAELSLQ